MITDYLKKSGNILYYNKFTIFLKGYSDYGAFSLGYDYNKFLPKLRQYGINLTREWACAYPNSWGGIQPFSDVNKSKLNEKFFENADRFIQLAAENDIFVLIDLLDRVGLTPKYFASHPYNKKNGGFLKKGLPDIYNFTLNTNVIFNAMAVVQRLSVHKNIIFQIINEPSGYETEISQQHLHIDIIANIRTITKDHLLFINPVMTKSDGYPNTPNVNVVKADGISIHGAGVKNPKNVNSCKYETMLAYLKLIVDSTGCPVLSDDDGLHAENLPCNRAKNDLLGVMGKAAKDAGCSGFLHRDSEPVLGTKLDINALKALQKI